MKTVEYYRNLGLVFVNGDFTIESDGSSNRGDSWFDVDMYFNQGSAFKTSKVESFAWRNNDGVKPEYKGAIEAVLNNGNKPKAYVSDLTWLRGFGSSIAKWRPVVLQSKSEDLKNKLASEISSTMGASGLTANGIINVLSEVFKPKPPFWNKSMQIFSRPCVAVNVDEPVKKFTIKEEEPSRIMTVNIEGRDYLIASHKQTVSPKEDNPMKPVYTAEMHAKNEPPPVGSEIKICIEEAGFELEGNDPKHEGKVVTVKAAFVNKDGEKIVAIENDKGNCACYIIECIKPIIKTIKVNGFDVPAPMSEAPEHKQMVYLAQAAHLDFNLDFPWQGDKTLVSWLSRGLVHSTKSAAIAHAKAMLGIDPNA